VIFGEAARASLLARYCGLAVPDLSYATVRDFCDSADHLGPLCPLDGDLKNVQRPWMVKAVLARVPAGASLLEVGAGPPLVAEALRELGYIVTVIDPYEGAGNGPTEYEAYRRAFPRLRFVRAEFGPEVAALRGERFDAVFSVSVLEHVRHRQLAGVFEGVARHLAPGGQSLHCIDHVLAGPGAAWHDEGLRLSLGLQEGLRGGTAAAAEAALDDLLRRLDRDVEAFFLSPQGHHLWRGGKPYDEFPFRKVVSIQSCVQRA
jgi:hypothetical protein